MNLALAHQRMAWLLVVCLTCCGCVRRRMTIRSNPPGATAYVDDQQIGTTPVSTPFVYYGTRKIQLVKDGYETLNLKHRFSPPWYQIPPLDFISENLLPQEIRDERIVEAEMEPQRIVSVPELLGRAQQLRDSSRQERAGAPVGVAWPSGREGYPTEYVPPNENDGSEYNGGNLPPAFYPNN